MCAIGCETVPKRAGVSNDAAKDQSRKALLTAGAALFVEATQVEPFAALRIRDVCERADYSTGAFYVHWKSPADFHEALSEHLVALDESAWETVFEELETIASSTNPADPAGSVDALASADLEATLGSPIWDAMELFVFTAGRTTRREVAAAGYADIDESTARAYGKLIDRLGREVRPPLTSTQIGTILQATIEGVAIRHRLDPRAVELEPSEHGMRSVYTAAVLSVIVTLTRRKADRRTLGELLLAELAS